MLVLRCVEHCLYMLCINVWSWISVTVLMQWRLFSCRKLSFRSCIISNLYNFVAIYQHSDIIEITLKELTERSLVVEMIFCKFCSTTLSYYCDTICKCCCKFEYTMNFSDLVSEFFAVIQKIILQFLIRILWCILLCAVDSSLIFYCCNFYICSFFYKEVMQCDLPKRAL